MPPAGWNHDRMAYAVANNDLEALLAEVADPLNPDDERSVHQRALDEAAFYGGASIVNTLLCAGVRPALRCYTGTTALHLAAQQGHAHVADLLLAAGVPVDVGDLHKVTPLALAIAFDKPEVAVLLLGRGADPLAPLPNMCAAVTAVRAYWSFNLVRLYCDYRSLLDVVPDLVAKAARAGSTVVCHDLLELGFGWRDPADRTHYLVLEEDIACDHILVAHGSPSIEQAIFLSTRFDNPQLDRFRLAYARPDERPPTWSERKQPGYRRPSEATRRYCRRLRAAVKAYEDVDRSGRLPPEMLIPIVTCAFGFPERYLVDALDAYRRWPCG